MPRIAAVPGGFARAVGGEPFTPRGFNYIRLHNRWHDTFSPQRYDAQRADAMLADLHQHGFNVVRVFIDHNAGTGVVADRAARTLSPAYMDNVADFVARAAKHQVHVIAALLYLPQCDRFRTMVPPDDEQAAGGNQHLVRRGGIDAKAAYMAEFAAALKARNPALLPAIFAYELDNETHLNAAAPPFSLRSGIITGVNGQTYDAASEVDLQRLADDHVVSLADACVDAVQQVDPQAMVSVNVFTFAAVGRSGPNRLHTDKSSDRRFPARPLALVRSKIAYLDIHFYPFDGKTLDRDLASIEWPALKAACGKRGMPLIMGEYGAFRKNFDTSAQAVDAVRRHLQRVREMGFAGDLYWTYDCDEQPYLWNARSEEGAIFRMLSEFR